MSSVLSRHSSFWSGQSVPPVVNSHRRCKGKDSRGEGMLRIKSKASRRRVRELVLAIRVHGPAYSGQYLAAIVVGLTRRYPERRAQVSGTAGGRAQRLAMATACPSWAVFRLNILSFAD